MAENKIDHGQYNLSFDLNGRKIFHRKWKVKDRMALDSAETQSDVRQFLAYNCLEDKNLVLDDYEYQYVLIKLRQASVGDEIKYNFMCTECKKTFDYVSKLSETMEPIDATYAPIEVGNLKLEMGPVVNRKLYESEVFSIKDITGRKIADFVLHIKSINGNATYSYKDMFDIVSDLDVDDFQEIWSQWNQMHFRLNRIHALTCPHCGANLLFEFDDLPDFFPEKWNMR